MDRNIVPHKPAHLWALLAQRRENLTSTPGFAKYSASEVSQHNNEYDCWIILHGKVFDITKYLDYHPGGKKILLSMAGKDATEKFGKKIHMQSFSGPKWELYVHIWLNPYISEIVYHFSQISCLGQLRSSLGELFGRLCSEMMHWYDPMQNYK